jgi:hypothetical protein
MLIRCFLGNDMPSKGLPKRKIDRLGSDLPDWVEKHVQKPAKELEAVAPAWASAMSGKAVAACRLVSCKGGTLKVAVASAAARSYVDAELRGGGLARLKRECPTVWRVRVAVVAEGVGEE